MNNQIVLDASAFLALAQEEKGAEIIKPLLKFTVMSTVNIAESLTALQRSNIEASDAMNLINDIISNIIPFDLEQAVQVAKLNQLVKHKVLSLGDRACLALGMKLQAPIYTADKIWAELDIDKADIKLIR